MFRPEFAPSDNKESLDSELRESGPAQKLRNSIEGGPDQKLRDGKFEGALKNERLTNEEAILYQRYATEIEEKDFSEQAEIYDEAEYLIGELQKIKGFDLSKYNVGKIDLSTAINRLKLEDGLLDVIQEFTKKENLVGFIDDVKKIKNGNGNNATILILAMIATALLSGQPNMALAQQNFSEKAVVTQGIEKESGLKIKVTGKGVNQSRKEGINAYLVKNGLSEIVHEVSINNIVVNSDEKLDVSVSITIIQNDGKRISVEGYRGIDERGNLGIFVVEDIEKLIKKYFDKDISLHAKPQFTGYQQYMCEDRAIVAAFEDYKRKLKIEKMPKVTQEKWRNDRGE